MTPGKKKKSNFRLLLILSAFLLIGMVCVAFFLTKKMSTNISTSKFPVYIRSYMASNTLYPNESGTCCDFVELYNSSEGSIDISGYHLTDDSRTTAYTVPNGTVIEGHGSYIIYCMRSGGDEYADLGISRAGGEELMLLNSKNVLIDSVQTVALSENASAVRQADGSFKINEALLTETDAAGISSDTTTEMQLRCVPGPISISEIIPSNTGYADERGIIADMVELVNTSDEEVDISGYILQQKIDGAQFTVPDGTVLAPGGYYVIRCTRTKADGCYANFALSRSGNELLLLYTPNNELTDYLTTISCCKNGSIIRENGVTVALDYMTPGFPNTEEGYIAFEATLPKTDCNLLISEVMPKNACTAVNGNGHFCDWVEIRNVGNESLDLSQFWISDREGDPLRCRLPQRNLAAGEYIIVWCSKDETAADGDILVPIGLSAKGGCVTIAGSDGRVIDKVEYASAEKDRSFIRDEGAATVLTEYPTPGFENTAEGYNAYLGAWIPEGLYISEVMPSNSTVARTNGDYYDWVELCNGSDGPITLSDYCLTDDAETWNKCSLPNITLESGEKYLIYCSGDTTLTDESSYHCSFSVNAGEDRIYLYRTDGMLADYLHVYHVPLEGSIGRDGRKSCIKVYEKPTPRKENSGGTEASQLSTMPVSDKASGVYDGTEGFFVALSGDGQIYYTLDGSKPVAGEKGTKRYTEPIEVKKTAVIRAVQIEPEKRPSEVLTLAYTVNEGHNVAVLNLVMDPEDFDGKNGIYSNPKETWEREACIVYTDANGTVTKNCGARIAGQRSRTSQQKSFKILFKDCYGGRLQYDIFGDTCEQKTFPALLIRAGLDSKYGIFREPLLQHLALPYRDTTFVQDSVPCVLYINGEYYGIYFFMEALTEETIADRINVTEDSITMFKGYLYPEHRYLEIYQLMTFLQKKDMTVTENYEYIKQHLCLEDLIDWAIFQAYSHNADVSANIRYFKSSETDGRWHFVLYDVECGFKAEAGFGIVLNVRNTSDFLVPLLKNSEFRDMFLKRLAYHCENTFEREKVLKLLYEFDAAIRPETERHFLRWELQPITYVYNFNQIERLIKEGDRVEDLKQSAKKYLKLSDEEYAYYFGGE